MQLSDPLYIALSCLACLPFVFLAGCLVGKGRIYAIRQSEASSGAATDDAETRRGLLLLEHAEIAFRSFSALTDNLHREMDQHNEQITAANTSLNLNGLSTGEVQRTVMRILEANTCLQCQLVDAQKTIQKQSAELEQRMLEANTDGLTGIGNRRAFDLELERQLAHWRRYERRSALALLDIDRFKEVNDVHGHLAGDAVLRAIAETIKSNVREVDFVARYGGEEFALILPETDNEGAMTVGDRLRKVIAATRIPWNEKLLAVTVSVGISTVSSLDDGEALTKRADEALYISKGAGRNRTTLVSPPAPHRQAGRPAATANP